MKKIFRFLSICAFAVNMTSCDYLDIVPDERAQESDTWANPTAIKRYLYSCYGYLPDTRSYPLSYWLPEEMTAVTKELFTTFKYGTYSPSSLSYTTTTWGTIWNGIRQCYMFQEALKKCPYNDEYTPEMGVLYNAEANFLIGYYHFLLFRSYGPTVIMHSAMDLNTQIADFPERNSVDEVVAFIDQKLTEAYDVLPTTFSGGDFGRATKLAVLAIKSRLYLYAASPLYNGNSEMYADFKSSIDGRPLVAQTFDLNKWQKCADVTAEAIKEVEKAGFHLYSDADAGDPSDAKPGLPNKAQRRLRYTIIDFTGGNPEAIWCDTRDDGYYGIQRRTAPRQTAGSYKGDLSAVICPTLQSVEQFYTDHGLPMADDKTFDYDGRYDWITAPANNDGNNYGDPAERVMRLCTTREPRFYSWVGYQNGYFEMGKYNDKDPGNGNPAKRAVLLQLLNNQDHGRGNRDNQNYCISGFVNKKWSKPEFQGAMIDYPMVLFRLGELYLNYAEALVELNRLDDAKVYLNKIRERAGIPDVDTAWKDYSNTPTKASTLDGLREIVRTERLNELYFEGHKFFDIRRWKIAEQHLGMPDRGLNTMANKLEDFYPTDLPLQRTFHKGQYLMPIPQSDIEKAPQIVQNPYY